MAKKIVLLSGPVSAGKTTLSGKLSSRYGVQVFKTRDVLKKHAEGIEQTREALQDFGEKLDQKTGGAWVRDGLIQWISTVPDNCVVIVDAVRIKGQIDAIRKAFGNIV